MVKLKYWKVDPGEQDDLQLGSQFRAADRGGQVGPDEDRKQQAVPAATCWRSGTAVAPPSG